MATATSPLPAKALTQDRLPISIRAFVPPPAKAKEPRQSRAPKQGPSEYTLVVDTETTVDERQDLRSGAWQFRKGVDLVESGIFYEPALLSTREQQTLQMFATRKGLRLITKAQFVDAVFYGMAYDLRAAIVGFNLPFDISRLAIRHGPARGKTMAGGFTFQLSSDKWKPRVQIKHLNSRAALIQFTKPRRRFDTRATRRDKLANKPRRGSFLDLKTIAAALTSRSFTLGSLAEFLNTLHRKQSTDEHGGAITSKYLDYAITDVQVTWECYALLRRKFDSHSLSQTLLSQILSEAGLGKAYLREMNIRPWRDVQPDFPDDLTGTIMSTYFGGRSEVHLRRMVVQVLYCDFLSMYPTVCTLMGLWRFVIAKGMEWRENTSEISALLRRLTLQELQRQDTWYALTTIVQVQPDDDVFPVRAKYDGATQPTIGLNHLNNKVPQWFTLADCIASKLLTGKAPKVLRAITFTPTELQSKLKAITVCGKATYHIDPEVDDFYRRLIDLRNDVKAQLKQSRSSDAGELDSEQQAIKILANATSYGIFVELNVEELDPAETRMCFGGSGEPFPVSTLKGEEPGRYFHPLIATLITGAARLMLAIGETLAIETGLDWALCDTDSMALAKPGGMGNDEFITRARSVCDWFVPLNPYDKKGPLFKIEDTNYAIQHGKLSDDLTPLFCVAISAKRYVLFNRTLDGGICIRKASAHGLGHLVTPYSDHDAPAEVPAPCMNLKAIGVDRWQYDLWHQIIRAAIDGHPDQVDLSYHPALGGPATSRYAATTPQLLRWFKRYNRNRPYRDQVRPFNFMLAFQPSPIAVHVADVVEVLDLSKKGPRKKQHTPKPIAPYDRNISRAALNCFDRETGKPVGPQLLKTYRQALAQYHLSPESKFLNGEPYDQGPTRRRHVEVIAIHHIGKEANRWEEQYYLGLDEDEVVDYGYAPSELAKMSATMWIKIEEIGQREVARESGVSRRTISRLMAGTKVKAKVLSRIANTLRKLATGPAIERLDPRHARGLPVSDALRPKFVRCR